MTKLIRDPELDRLVEQLNQTNEAAGDGDDDSPDTAAARPAAAAPEWPPAQVPSGNVLESMLIEMARRGASDLLIVAGSEPVFRVGGRLLRGESAPLSGDEIQSTFSELMTSRVREKIDSNGSTDFSLRLGKSATDDDRRAWRFRVNIHRQRGTLAAAIRALPTEVPTISQLSLPASLNELVKATRGLVLVCGPTGSGKSTTLAAMVGAI